MLFLLQNSNLEPEEVPVKESVVMKPDFAARNETHDSAAPAHAPVDLAPADYDAAATKIQRQWRKRKEENVKADTPEDLDQNNTFKMSEEVIYNFSGNGRNLTYILYALYIIILFKHFTLSC